MKDCGGFSKEFEGLWGFSKEFEGLWGGGSVRVPGKGGVSPSSNPRGERVPTGLSQGGMNLATPKFPEIACVRAGSELRA